MATVNKVNERTPLVGPGEGSAIWYLNTRMTIKASGATTGGGFSLIEAVLPPGTSPPLHIHHTEDEPNWIVEGELTYQVGDQSFDAAAGSFVFLPRGIPHTFLVRGDSPARVLIQLQPAGGEGYFIEIGRPADTEGLPAPGPIDFAEIERVGAKYQIEIVGPPLSPEGR
jgi:quercetin dioxygenase-like cupin family protein